MNIDGNKIFVTQAKGPEERKKKARSAELGGGGSSSRIGSKRGSQSGSNSNAKNKRKRSDSVDSSIAPPIKASKDGKGKGKRREIGEGIYRSMTWKAARRE